MRIPGQVEAGGFRALVADQLLRQRVLVLAVVVVVARVEPRSDLVVPEAAADRERVVLPAVLRKRRAHGGLDVLAGRPCYEIDGARIGVASVQRALRSLDDFDPLEAVDVEALDVARPVNAVHEVRRARLDAELHAGQHVRLAANDRPVRGAPERLRELQARRELRNVVDVAQTLVLDRLAGHRRHRDRSALQGFPDQSRRDDDLLELLRESGSRDLAKRSGNREAHKRGT